MYEYIKGLDYSLKTQLKTTEPVNMPLQCSNKYLSLPSSSVNKASH